MITIKNVSKTYPSFFPKLKKLFGLTVKPSVEALKNVSFEVEKGEIFGLIGRNGAGKTTLTKIIATLVQPTSGRVKVDGFDSVTDEVKARSLLGLATAEERSFYWRLSGEKNMMFFARLYGMSDKVARQRISQIFEQIGFSDLANRRFSDLSTGNKQKLAIARALLSNPPVLLLDEPTRSLDPLAASQIRELISSLKDKSILLTSHNLSEIEELCQRIAIISQGEIKTIGTPEELRRQHKTSQNVKIIFNGLSEKDLEEFSVEKSSAGFMLSFTRETDDYLLGETINRLTAKGAKILDVETHKATLLDVLESYESNP